MFGVVVVGGEFESGVCATFITACRTKHRYQAGSKTLIHLNRSVERLHLTEFSILGGLGVHRLLLDMLGKPGIRGEFTKCFAYPGLHCKAHLGNPLALSIPAEHRL